MTTLATSTVQHQRPFSTAPRMRPVPFLRLIRVESRKLVDTRAGLGLLIAIGVVTAGINTLLLFTLPPEGLTFPALALASALPQSVLLPILGILAATSEWSQRTGLVTFALEPRRARVAGAKLVAAGLASLLAVVAALALGAITNLTGLLFFDGQGDWTLSGSQLAGAVLYQLIGVALGVSLGLALQNGPLAIVAFLVLPTMWSFASALVPGLDRFAPWLDLNTATSPVLEATMRAADWAHLGTAGLVWLGLPYAIGVLRLTRREVK